MPRQITQAVAESLPYNPFEKTKYSKSNQEQCSSFGMVGQSRPRDAVGRRGNDAVALPFIGIFFKPPG